MTTTHTEEFELVDNNHASTISTGDKSQHAILSSPNATDGIIQGDDIVPSTAVDAIPDGGYGWTIVLSCAIVTFIFNGWGCAWGIIQTALLSSQLQNTPNSTLSFVGSLSLALTVSLGLLANRLTHKIGAQWGMLAGCILVSLGTILGSFTLDRVGGLFATAGVCFGVGNSLLYTVSNNLPAQWFSSHLGTANGLVKLGGGIGATVWALAIQALIDKVGIAWAFRVFGLVSLVLGIFASSLVKERGKARSAPFVDWSLFKSLPFCCLFVAGAIGTLGLFVPSYFLPLFAHSIGLSASTGAAVVASFNACTAVGRFLSGYACDKLGSTNMLLFTMAINAVSMLAIWPFSSTLAPLFAFAAINGLSNGAFFVTMPTTVASIVGPGQAAVAMGMAVTGWTGGYLMGSPIAGMLIAATGAESGHSVKPYRAAIFYSGGVALASAAFVLVARLSLDGKVIKKL